MAVDSPDLASLESELRTAVRGEVSFDKVTRGLHSTDASHYQIMPACVVVPRDMDDAVAAIRIAGRHNLPITPRGGATSLSGQTTWNGMVIDCSKYMNQLIELNVQQRWARVGPGAVRDELNTLLKPHNLHFSPDPATGNRATAGGMIGNNSSGTRSIVYGKTVDNVLAVKIALTDGTVLDLKNTGRDEWEARSCGEGVEARIYRGFKKVIDDNHEEIEARYPKVMRRVSGYNLDAYLKDFPWNFADLISGSEGTLGVLLEATIKLTPNPKATALCIVHFDDLLRSLETVPQMLTYGPAAVELLDQFILHEAIRNRSTAALADFLIGDPGAILIVEFFGDSPAEAADKAERFAAEMKAKGIGYAWPTRTDPAGQDRVWTVRKLGLGLMSNVKGPRKRQAFIEDACVPVEVLAEYIGKVLKICEKHEVPVSMYAHASVGVLHVDPMLDMHLPTEQAKMRAITEEVFELVRHYGGSFSGEHGDGIVRGEFLPRFFGPKLYQAFRDIKQLFDPKGLMNPGKIIDPPSMLEHLRYGPAYRMTNVANNFQYRDQGGFQLAVEQCNGVGACRKTGSGTMCPSYMATKDEEHCTRGRANALRLAMTGQFNGNTLGSDRIKEVLDLCLACKACKSECPNSVDMAKLKSDVLQMHHDEHGTPLGAKMIGAMPKMARYLAGPLAPIVNAVQHFGPYKWLLEKVAGIDRRRDLPPFTTRPFKKWYQHRATPTPTVNHKQVVLFADTYINYFEPSVGQAAVELLESCGYRVTIAQPGCCQRTRISKGLVRQAKRDGLRTLQNLDQYVQQGLTIVVCEPSCASSLTDDLPDLIDDAELGQRVASSVKMIDVFLAEELANGNLDCRFTSPYRKILLHGHCHQKALYGTTAMKAIYARVEGLEVDEVDSGCCGMAGSFGYEHFELSMKVAEDRLFPAVRNRSADTAVVASGLSCRHQMHDGLDVQACHWVQTVRGVRK